MNPELLETLVKLAAAGTSGVCVLCVAATGFVTWKLPDSAPAKKYQALKHYMFSSLGIALISACTTGLAGYWDFKTKQALRDQNQHLEIKTEAQAKEIAVVEERASDLQQSVDKAEAQLELAKAEKAELEFQKTTIASQLSTAKIELAEMKKVISDIGKALPASKQ